ISGSKSSRGAALFNKPTSSSNSVANTEEGNLMDGALKKETEKHVFVLTLLKCYNKCYVIHGKISELHNDSYVKCWQHQFS
uniref:Uncharacterized protein n=1 Tax=Taeniopygia guttata TaxID=59729 RepID=A0A674HD31_TAEGU